MLIILSCPLSLWWSPCRLFSMRTYPHPKLLPLSITSYSEPKQQFLFFFCIFSSLWVWSLSPPGGRIITFSEMNINTNCYILLCCTFSTWPALLLTWEAGQWSSLASVWCLSQRSSHLGRWGGLRSWLGFSWCGLFRSLLYSLSSAVLDYWV